MGYQGYLSDTDRVVFNAALFGVFETFKREFTLYLDARTAVVNTTPNFAGMFGDASQNATGPGATPVAPQLYVLSGCIKYGNGQPWEFIGPVGNNDQQNKVRESEGQVRIKVDRSGYALLKDCQQVVLDGFTFTLDTTPRPHGLVGDPDRWTFHMLKVDPS